MADPHFKGKTALISGSGAGIGRASAIAFAAKGARVMVCDLNLAAAEETAALIHAAGGEAEAINCDATNAEAVERLIKATLDRFGSLDFAHNNVGCGTGKPLEQLTEDDYNFSVDLSFKSAFLGMRYQLPVMRERGGGSIVNTASMAGISTTQASDIVYSGAKAGVIQMTAHAARTYGQHNVRVNCIAPGLVATEGIRSRYNLEEQSVLASDHIIKRAVLPEEIAAAVIFLCSAEAAMITGIVMPVDGGQNANR
ncbi:SDR family oxidoreductase [Sphingobium sp. HBC34]|uniref:SDR family oxidoreductase n=1 Tax=Sphingobium cyanobacteriorum TaxID=3063954 RepID=A0ABT8ZQM2_9SPHN|nr:SDR family oxidoreductase [Sphingobium sp. HBC34]MDO7836378.1 SDR family oxidoreductase [Sphingobium sp. HBC34]